MAANLVIHPAFYRRVRHYRDRISSHDGRPQVAARFVNATQDIVLQLLENPGRGHSAGFEAADLADVLRANLPGFPVFAIFYRWNGRTLTIISVEHAAQDLPSRVATILSSS